MFKKRSWILLTGLLLALPHVEAVHAADGIDLAVMKVRSVHRVHPGDAKKVHIQIKNLIGLGGSGTITVTATNDSGTAAIFSGPFTLTSDSKTTEIQVDYAFRITDIPQVSFKACISIDGDINPSNNCNSDVSLVAP